VIPLIKLPFFGVPVDEEVFQIAKRYRILSNAVINPEAHVGSYGVLASNVSLSGRVQVGEGCYLGSGCVVREDTKIGEGAIVGMGSVVIRDVPPKTVVVGNPAQVLRKLE
jgi:acetyltransferase-like isoleucine patch superfamily enzyme